MVSENCFKVSEKKRFSFVPVGGNHVVLASRVPLLWIDAYFKDCRVGQEARGYIPKRKKSGWTSLI